MSRRRRMPAVTAPLDDEVVPRSWAKVRWTMVFVVLVLAPAAVRVWWGWAAESRLRAVATELRSRGEPVRAEDFPAEPDVPDEQNAAAYLRRAAVTLGPVVNGRGVRGWQAMDATQLALAEIRKGRLAAPATGGRPSAPSESESEESHVRRLNSLYGAVRELIQAASISYSDWRYGAAVDNLLDALFVGRGLEQEPHIQSVEMAQAVRSLVAKEVEFEAPSLRVSAVAGGADRAQVRRLIDELLETNSARCGLIRALQAERPRVSWTAHPDRRFAWRRPASGPDGLPAVPAPVWLEASATTLFRPYATMHEAVALRRNAAAVEAARHADEWRVSAPRPTPPPGRTGLPGVDIVTDLFGDEDASLHVMSYQWAAESTGTAARDLAIRLYVVDHGRRPTSLAELVPDYVPALTPYIHAILPPSTAPTGRPNAVRRPAATAPGRSK